jgi:hypothetical protein
MILPLPIIAALGLKCAHPNNDQWIRVTNLRKARNILPRK